MVAYETGLFDFVGVGEMAETTTQLLSIALHGGVPEGRSVGRVEQLVLQQARDYLSEVREGFVLSVRTERIGEVGELRYLIDRILTDWESVEAELDRLLGTKADGDGSGAAEGCSHTLQAVRRQLMAYGMAAIALGALPRMPAGQVTFPRSYGKPPTYADIPVPVSPGHMLARIEELEKTVTALLAHSPAALVERSYGPVRRTYGFFEASAFLVRRDSRRFGIKTRTN